MRYQHPGSVLSQSQRRTSPWWCPRISPPLKSRPRCARAEVIWWSRCACSMPTSALRSPRGPNPWRSPYDYAPPIARCRPRRSPLSARVRSPSSRHVTAPPCAAPAASPRSRLRHGCGRYLRQLTTRTVTQTGRGGGGWDLVEEYARMRILCSHVPHRRRRGCLRLCRG